MKNILQLNEKQLKSLLGDFTASLASFAAFDRTINEKQADELMRKAAVLVTHITASDEVKPDSFNMANEENRKASMKNAKEALHKKIDLMKDILTDDEIKELKELTTETEELSSSDIEERENKSMKILEVARLRMAQKNEGK